MDCKGKKELLHEIKLIFVQYKTSFHCLFLFFFGYFSYSFSFDSNWVLYLLMSTLFCLLWTCIWNIQWEWSLSIYCGVSYKMITAQCVRSVGCICTLLLTTRNTPKMTFLRFFLHDLHCFMFKTYSFISDIVLCYFRIVVIVILQHGYTYYQDLQCPYNLGHMIFHLWKWPLTNMQITRPWPPVGRLCHDLITLRQKKTWT